MYLIKWNTLFHLKQYPKSTNMTDFLVYDNAAHAAATPAEKIKIYREITKKAQVDPEFRKTIDNERFMNSTRAFTHLLNKEPTQSGLKIGILGYKVALMGEWDPFDTITGLPGSEECAVYASEELARRGHSVTLYLSPPDNSIWRSPFSNPRWLPEDMYYAKENKDYYDLILMWRRFDVDTGRKRSKVVFLWPHDSPGSAVGATFPKFDGVCMLSEHQRRQFSRAFTKYDKIPYTICGNGIVPEQFNEPMSFTNPYSVGYFSNYARGLAVLILIWPEIKEEFPEATLSICYGRETWGTLTPGALQSLVNKIEQYKNLGVTEHGKVGHLELASIMQRTSVWAYSANYQGNGETYCITAVKCQASGCIPVTTRIGALNETVHPEAPSSPNITDMNSIQQYKEQLLRTLRRIRDSDPEVIKAERQKYIDFAREFSWAACVDKWLNFYNTIAQID
jgi:glycosyltransferase involved in cell wall biosynthesis